MDKTERQEKVKAILETVDGLKASDALSILRYCERMLSDFSIVSCKKEQ